MIDFDLLQQSEATQEQYLFCFLLINLIFFITYNNKFKSGGSFWGWIAIVLFCIFGCWDPDYFSFRERFYTSLKDYRDPLYYHISQISLNSYTLFRFIIWGTALSLFNKSLQKFNVHYNTALFIFAVSCLPLFAQMRASLGLAAYCYGLSLLIMNREHRLSVILGGLIAICLSYFGHRSMIVPILLTPLILLKPKKIYVFLFIVVGVGAGQIMANILTDIASGDLTMSTNTALSGAEEGLVHYASKESIVTHNWKYTLTTNLRRHSYTIIFMYCLWICFFSKKRTQISESTKWIMMVCCGLFAIGISIFIVGNLGATLMGERFLFYLGPLLCIVLTNIWRKGLCRPKTIYLILLPGFLFVEFFIFGKILSF